MPPTQYHYDAIVLGAGVSGLAAAADLERAGLNVLCLEARPRIGGRILTHREPLSPVPFELGAEFIHGSPPELLEIADAAGLLLCDLGDHDTYLRDGEWQSEAALDEGDDGVGGLMEQLAHYTGPDQTWAAFAASASASDEVKRNATRYVEGFNAARAEIISVASLRQDHLAAAELDEDRQFRILSGYDQVPLWLARELHAPQQTIHLNSIVESVVWERGSVAVSVRGREQPFTARACVITFPVGVLQNSPTLFSPAPQQQLTAAANIASGEVYRVVLRFDENFWEAIPGIAGASFLLTDEEPFPTWWTSTPIRSSVITAWSAGPHTDTLIGRPPGEVVREATGTLARITGRAHSAIEDQLRSWHVHDWHSDPFSRGAYTYAKAGHLDARAQLAEPVEDTLFFAGEATETAGHSATVHGAIATGRRAAREVARALDGKPLR